VDPTDRGWNHLLGLARYAAAPPLRDSYERGVPDFPIQPFSQDHFVVHILMGERGLERASDISRQSTSYDGPFIQLLPEIFWRFDCTDTEAFPELSRAPPVQSENLRCLALLDTLAE